MARLTAGLADAVACSPTTRGGWNGPRQQRQLIWLCRDLLLLGLINKLYPFCICGIDEKPSVPSKDCVLRSQTTTRAGQ